jgi:hypothetical protein
MIRIQAKRVQEIQDYYRQRAVIIPTPRPLDTSISKERKLGGAPTAGAPFELSPQAAVTGRLRGICNTIRNRTGIGFGWDCCDLKDCSTSAGRQNQPLSG